MKRALPLMAVLAAGCLDFDDAEAELCRSRPGLCPTSPPVSLGDELVGTGQACSPLTLVPGEHRGAALIDPVTEWRRCDPGCDTVIDVGPDTYVPTLEDVGKTISAQRLAKWQDGAALRDFQGPKVDRFIAEPVRAALPVLMMDGFEWGFPEARTFVGTNVVHRPAGARSGRGALLIEPTNSVVSHGRWDFQYYAPAASVRMSFFVDPTIGMPTVSSQLAEWTLPNTGSGGPESLRVNIDDGRVFVSSSSRTVQSEFTVGAGEWFELELQLGPEGGRWWLNDAEQPALTDPFTTAGPWGNLIVGTPYVGTPYRAFVDDVVLAVWGDLAAIRRLGNGRVLPLLPDRTGVHLSMSAFERYDPSNGTSPLPIPDDSHLLLGDTWPDGMEDGVRQVADEPAAFLEHGFEPLPWDGAPPSAVTLTWQYQFDPGAMTAATAKSAWATGAGVYPGFSVSNSDGDGWKFAYGVLPLPDGVPWSLCSVNDLRARFGFHTGTPRAWLEAMDAEVYVP